MIAPFTILSRIADGGNHLMTAEELILLAKEAAFAPCMVTARYRPGEHDDQIEIVIHFKHEPPLA